MACVFIELGQDAHINGDLTDAVNEGVRRGYEKAYLRKSITADPLQRVNTGDNTPAFLTVHLVPGSGCKITVAPTPTPTTRRWKKSCWTPSTLPASGRRASAGLLPAWVSPLSRSPPMWPVCRWQSTSAAM